MLKIGKLPPLTIFYLRFYLIIVPLLLVSNVSWSKVDQCINCHQDLHPEIVNVFHEDVHYSRGLSCSDCHGGNPDVPDESGMDKKYGFLGTPTTDKVPAFCARCHSNTAYMRPFNPSLPTDQLDKYWTSQHGIRLKSGDKSVATCVSCHGSHHILPGSDPRSMVNPMNVAKTCAHCHSNEKLMEKYGIPTYHYAQYTDSANVHGYALFIKGDLSAPTCNDCHGNHGAAPPKVEQVAQVCTQCHSQNGEFFRRSPHKEAFDALGIMECAFCHQKEPDINHPTARIHTIVKPDYKMMVSGSTGICSQCHSDGDGGMSLASLVYGDLDSLYKKLHRTEELLNVAERRGLETSDARWKLHSEVLQARMELRTVIHTFDKNIYQEYFYRADTSLEKVLQIALIAHQELHHRYLYFVIATIFIVLTIIALIFKIRDLNRRDINRF